MQNSFDPFSKQAEADLVRAAQAGSHDAFAELLRRSHPRLYRAAYAILENVDDAEDAVQTASWKAYEHLGAFRHESSVNTWLTTIVVNQARMRLREIRRARLVWIDDSAEGRASLPPLAAGDPDPEEAYAGGEIARALHLEIRRLPVQLRQVMLLYIENRSMTEAADRLGVSLAAAKTRLFRARQELYNRMRRYGRSNASIRNDGKARATASALGVVWYIRGRELRAR